MLLFIAIANAPLFLYGTTSQLSDQIMVFIIKVLLNDTSRLLFIFMFLYGFVQQKYRLEVKNNLDWHRIRKLLERRCFTMILIGILHVTILAPIDIIAIYGMMGIIFIDFLRFNDKVLWWFCCLSYAFLIYLFIVHGQNYHSEIAVFSSLSQHHPFFISLKFSEWMKTIIPTILTALPIVFIGILSARYRILDEPFKHVKLLKWTALLGLSILSLNSILLALNFVFPIHTEDKLFLFVNRFYMPASIAGALGMVALFGWTVVSVEHKRNNVVLRAIVALGQRSLTFYLFQSFIFIIMFAPYAGGLGNRVGQTGSTGIAVATWILSLTLAEIMQRYQLRGPAETLLRKITYHHKNKLPQNEK